MIDVKPLNAETDTFLLSMCVKSQYQRNSIVNFLKPTGGRAATAVLVIYA